jgi:hypothetical protein
MSPASPQRVLKGGDVSLAGHCAEAIQLHLCLSSVRPYLT